MSLTRTIFIALAIMLPTTWTVAKAEEGSSTETTKTTKKTKKSKKADGTGETKTETKTKTETEKK
jgi:hypothetical protein